MYSTHYVYSMYSWYISVLPALFLGELCVITITEPPRFEKFYRTNGRTDGRTHARTHRLSPGGSCYAQPKNQLKLKTTLYFKLQLAQLGYTEPLSKIAQCVVSVAFLFPCTNSGLVNLVMVASRFMNKE